MRKKNGGHFGWALSLESLGGGVEHVCHNYTVTYAKNVEPPVPLTPYQGGKQNM